MTRPRIPFAPFWPMLPWLALGASVTLFAIAMADKAWPSLTV